MPFGYTFGCKVLRQLVMFHHPVVMSGNVLNPIAIAEPQTHDHNEVLKLIIIPFKINFGEFQTFLIHVVSIQIICDQ